MSSLVICFIGVSVAQSCPTLCTPWTAAHQATLSFTVSWSLLKLMSIESVMTSNHLILYCRLLFLPSVFPSIIASIVYMCQSPSPIHTSPAAGSWAITDSHPTRLLGSGGPTAAWLSAACSLFSRSVYWALPKTASLPIPTAWGCLTLKWFLTGFRPLPLVGP